MIDMDGIRERADGCEGCYESDQCDVVPYMVRDIRTLLAEVERLQAEMEFRIDLQRKNLDRAHDAESELARLREGILGLCEEGIELDFASCCDYIPPQAIYAILKGETDG